MGAREMAFLKHSLTPLKFWLLTGLFLGHPLLTIACAQAPPPRRSPTVESPDTLAQGTACQRQGRFTDIAYATIPGVPPQLTSLDIYVPEGARDRPLPVVIYVHGGSWRKGDKAHVGAKPAFFNGEGAIFVSVNYRLSPDPPSADPNGLRHPAHTQDVASAIAWLHDNIQQYCGDPNRMALIGHSAGAHLVSLVTTDESFLGAHNLDPSAIQCVGALDTGAYDIPTYLDRMRQGDSRAARNQITTYENAFGTDPAAWRQASPMTHVAAGKQIPDFFVIAPDDRAKQPIATDFAETLEQAGVETVLHPAPGLSHEEINTVIGQPRDQNITPQLGAFLRDCLAPGQAAASTQTPALAQSQTPTIIPAAVAGEVTPLSQLVFSQDYTADTDDLQGATEVNYIVNHQGKLFANVSYWNADRSGETVLPGPRVIRKDRYDGRWEIDHEFGPGYVRSAVMASLTLTTDGTGKQLNPPVKLLVAGAGQAYPNKESTLWTRNDATGEWARISLSTSTERLDGEDKADVRSLASYTDKQTGVNYLFVGTSAGQVFQGVYDPTAPGRLRFDPQPVFQGPGRIHSMAEFQGAFYISVGVDQQVPGGGLYRRVDGNLGTNPSQAQRWQLVYDWPAPRRSPAGGMRAITGVPNPQNPGRPVILGAREVPGIIVRIDPSRNYADTIELNLQEFFQNLWQGWPERGRQINLAAYNEFTPVTHPDTGEKVHLVGVWVVHPNYNQPPYNGSHYLVRHQDGTYDAGYVYDYNRPLSPGEELRGTRTIVASPFPEDKGRVFYFGGYDAYAGGKFGGKKVDTAWIYRGVLPPAPPQ